MRQLKPAPHGPSAEWKFVGTVAGGLLLLAAGCTTPPYERCVPCEQGRTNLGTYWSKLLGTNATVTASSPMIAYSPDIPTLQYLTTNSASKVVTNSASKVDFHRLLWTNDPYATLHSFRIRGVPGSTTDSKKIDPVGQLNGLNLSFLYGEEFEAIKRAKTDYSRKIGVALSGAGIRSTSVATGFLMGLHEIGVLAEIGYLSTVSGG